MIQRELEIWLSPFGMDEFLCTHVVAVLARVPAHVRDDLRGDADFRWFDYEPGPGVVRHVPVGRPGSGRPARSIELKRTLRHRPVEFVRYVIAHEVAHAHLRNAGRWPGDDPEHAADALAADWGFPRPVVANR